MHGDLAAHWLQMSDQAAHVARPVLRLRTAAAAVCVCYGAGLVVVVSPLLALMRDQLERLPKGLPGAMLQGSMSRQEVEQVRRGGWGCGCCQCSCQQVSVPPRHMHSETCSDQAATRIAL
jgi:superfamily II DNA helicase RecQ